jgi:hypothetical protein
MIEIEIHIKGKLAPSWSDWFDNLTLRPGPEGDTILTGTLPDSAAVYGVISRISSLGLTLITVDCRESPSGTQRHLHF